MAQDLPKILRMDTTKIQLDYLKMHMHNHRRGRNTDEILQELKTLHAKGFFKKLRLKIGVWPDNSAEMLTFNALEVLNISASYTNALSDLAQLKELNLDVGVNVDLDTMAKNLIHLERLTVESTID